MTAFELATAGWSPDPVMDSGDRRGIGMGPTPSGDGPAVVSGVSIEVEWVVGNDE